MEPEGASFCYEEGLLFCCKSAIRPWPIYSSPIASLYFKKSSTDRNSSLYVLKQLRGLSWFGFLQSQILRQGFECKDFIWATIPRILVDGGAVGDREETECDRLKNGTQQISMS